MTVPPTRFQVADMPFSVVRQRGPAMHDGEFGPQIHDVVVAWPFIIRTKQHP